VATLQLIFAAMTFAIVIAYAGFVAALKPAASSTPSRWFWRVGPFNGQVLARLLMMYLFALKLGWLPSFGYGVGGLKYLICPR